jgi:S1-C subfamily serine protease
MTKRCRFSLAIVLFVIGARTIFACDVCYTYRFDWCTCNGYINSTSNGQCYCALSTPVSFLDMPHPGFFATQKSGKLVVNVVLPESPASRAGILPGDEILSINGRPLLNHCVNPEDPWASDDSAGRAHVELRRSNLNLGVTVELVSMSGLIEPLWASNRGVSAYGSLRQAKVSSAVTHHMSGAYTFGLEVTLEGDTWVVTDTLIGGPASEAGITPGAVISAVDGIPVDDLSAHDGQSVGLSKLTSPESGIVVKLDLVSNGKPFEVSLTPLSWSRAVSRPVRSLPSQELRLVSLGKSGKAR